MSELHDSAAFRRELSEALSRPLERASQDWRAQNSKVLAERLLRRQREPLRPRVALRVERGVSAINAARKLVRLEALEKLAGRKCAWIECVAILEPRKGESVNEFTARDTCCRACKRKANNLAKRQNDATSP